jgi:hypothetical protein
MSLSNIKNGTSRTYVITTQNVEEYGTNFHKFKGGSTYSVHFEVTEAIYEENAYGEGEHSYYHVPSLTEASVAALVMKHVNRFNGLRGSFDYITDITVVNSPFDTPDHPDFSGWDTQLIEEIDAVNKLEVA